MMVKRILLLTRINYPQMIEVKILKRDAHETTPAGGVSVFKLEAVASAFNQHQ